MVGIAGRRLPGGEGERPIRNLMATWIMSWIRSPRRMWKIYVRNRCPDCNGLLCWGQWNDGAWAGRPFCLNRHEQQQSEAKPHGD